MPASSWPSATCAPATDEVTSPEPLEAEAEALDLSPEGARYGFRVLQDGVCLLSGEATLSMRRPR